MNFYNVTNSVKFQLIKQILEAWWLYCK